MSTATTFIAVKTDTGQVVIDAAAAAEGLVWAW